MHSDSLRKEDKFLCLGVERVEYHRTISLLERSKHGEEMFFFLQQHYAVIFSMPVMSADTAEHLFSRK